MSTGLPAPVFLMRASLRAVPPPVLCVLLRRVTAGLSRNHAPLLRRLARIAPARVLFAPIDVPHCFLLSIAKQGVTLTLAGSGQAADVTMRGSLATLIDLLEGRTDSDTMFFSRDLSVSGDTAIAVAFRNTLDGEMVNLVDDALARLGPFAAPAGRVAVRVHRRVDAIIARLATVRDTVHRAAHAGHDPVLDRTRIIAALDDLAARVGKLEGRGRQNRSAA
jgi:predicted lipid carrier protein YhbT